MPSRVGGEQDGPVQSPRATFSFRGKKMLHKMVSEVQKLFNEKNLNKVFFQVENTVGATRAISLAAIAMWFIHISINGLFLQEVGCNSHGSSHEPNSGETCLPTPCHGTSAPGGICSSHALHGRGLTNPWLMLPRTSGESKYYLD